MRGADVGHWLRFHSLPDSKRHAVTQDERRIVLGRANTIACTALGEGAPCWLIQAGEAALGWPADAERPRITFGLQHVNDYEFDETRWPTYAVLTTFRPGAFDALIVDIAEDRAFRTLWMSPVNGRVFAPYEGGIDLFLESASLVDELKAAHKQWLSPREDGL